MFVESKPMKLKTEVVLNLKIPEAQAKLRKAVSGSLKDTVVAIARDTIVGSPYLTGHNRRSIKFELGPGGEVAKRELEAAVYSTSGYGGYIETGTAKMAARPYFKPALDRNIRMLPQGIKARLR